MQSLPWSSSSIESSVEWYRAPVCVLCFKSTFGLFLTLNTTDITGPPKKCYFLKRKLLMPIKKQWMPKSFVVNKYFIPAAVPAAIRLQMGCMAHGRMYGKECGINMHVTFDLHLKPFVCCLCCAGGCPLIVWKIINRWKAKGLKMSNFDSKKGQS